MAATVARNARQAKKARWRAGLQRRARRSGAWLSGSALIAAALLLLLALVSYRPSDPSLNTSAGGPVRNWLGTPGAYASDLLLSVWGPPVGLLLPLLLILGIRLARGTEAGRWLRAMLITLLGIILIGLGASLLAG